VWGWFRRHDRDEQRSDSIRTGPDAVGHWSPSRAADEPAEPRTDPPKRRRGRGGGGGGSRVREPRRPAPSAGEAQAPLD
jgi:hypothetical protein